MTTIPQTPFSAQHTLQFDEALRQARTQLPRTADQARADRGLVLARSGAVTLASTTEALVSSGTDAEIVYHVHSRGGCDCPDGQRRLAAMPDAQPGVRACKHHLAAILVAMAHVNLAIKGYVPEALGEVWYPAVYQGESGCAWSGRATDTAASGWWFAFGDGEGGLYCSVRSLELWERTPLHVTDWQGQVSRWERWLSAR